MVPLGMGLGFSIRPVKGQSMTVGRDEPVHRAQNAARPGEVHSSRVRVLLPKHGVYTPN